MVHNGLVVVWRVLAYDTHRALLKKVISLESKVGFMHESSSDFTFDSIAQKFLLRELVGAGVGVASIVFFFKFTFVILIFFAALIFDETFVGLLDEQGVRVKSALSTTSLVIVPENFYF